MIAVVTAVFRNDRSRLSILIKIIIFDCGIAYICELLSVVSSKIMNVSSKIMNIKNVAINNKINDNYFVNIKKLSDIYIYNN